MGCLINEKDKSSLMWQIESNTGWNWEIGDLKDVLYLRLSGPSEQENHWWIVRMKEDEQDVEDVLKANEDLGYKSPIHLYDWFEIPYDNDYPHYFPAKPAFYSGVKRLQVNMANIRRKLGIKPGENNYIVNELGVGYRMNTD